MNDEKLIEYILKPLKGEIQTIWMRNGKRRYLKAIKQEADRIMKEYPDLFKE